jgi:hypothetical protein
MEHHADNTGSIGHHEAFIRLSGGSRIRVRPVFCLQTIGIRGRARTPCAPLEFGHSGGEKPAASRLNLFKRRQP